MLHVIKANNIIGGLML